MMMVTRSVRLTTSTSFDDDDDDNSSYFKHSGCAYSTVDDECTVALV